MRQQPQNLFLAMRQKEGSGKEHKGSNGRHGGQESKEVTSPASGTAQQRTRNCLHKYSQFPLEPLVSSFECCRALKHDKDALQLLPRDASARPRRIVAVGTKKRGKRKRKGDETQGRGVNEKPHK
ncbi:hypothetical protein TcCL_Unassigned00640 [Trypanosoma cruzi]|nr:hypothetical protein TcCL_Unassigned00640 [Trypanosoma cruzi]